jgi:hypothetical protein
LTTVASVIVVTAEEELLVLELFDSCTEAKLKAAFGRSKLVSGKLPVGLK